MFMGFENTCTVSEGSEMSPGLFQDFMHGYETLRLSSLAVEHILVVMTAGFQLRIESYG